MTLVSKINFFKKLKLYPLNNNNHNNHHHPGQPQSPSPLDCHNQINNGTLKKIHLQGIFSDNTLIHGTGCYEIT
ncbi:hypothetical protein SCA6_004090 [Theobroma cacao]